MAKILTVDDSKSIRQMVAFTLQSAGHEVTEAEDGQAALDLSGDLVLQHGTLVIVGYHESNAGRRDVDIRLWNFKAIDVLNGHVRRMDEKLEAMREGVELMQSGELRTEPLVSLYPLEKVQDAFSDFGAAKEGLFKAVLIPERDEEQGPTDRLR